mgnify:CR=1 FL=1
MFPLPKDVNIEEFCFKQRFTSMKNYHDDADNNFAVRVRLKNTTKEPQKLQWLLRFYTRGGSQIGG